jgi:hypothetical protein
VYESPIASLQSGAYAVRVTQTKPGENALGRTLGLVAPTPAEYRLLGANEPLLGAIRSATGGKTLLTPASAWVHDLRATSRATDLWPWLLILALLLWPLDVALRRVSLGRRELADGRRWIVQRVRGRGPAVRTAAMDDLIAARGRAGSAGAREALVRKAAEAKPETEHQDATTTPKPDAPKAVVPPTPEAAPIATKPETPPPADRIDTLAHLRDRRRDRH